VRLEGLGKFKSDALKKLCLLEVTTGITRCAKQQGIDREPSYETQPNAK
jgi:hypothetical protein